MRVLLHIGHAPAGYRRNGSRRLVRSEPDASAVAEAFRKRALGASWAELADFLTAGGVHPASGGDRWSKPDVAALIRNPVYLGDGGHEPIVSRDDFEAAQADVCSTQNGSLASLDGRSMLYNQQYFLAALVREVRHANRARRREPEPQLALIALDGDDFREINAVHGLRAGDDVLAEIGARIRWAVPHTTDLVAHYRGDEFVVLLPGTSLDRARATAARLLTELQARIGSVGRVTFSIGIAALRPGERADVFFARAQQAQRRAKDLGKNRVEIAE